MMKKYREKARLLFTDTDSLLYAIKTQDIYDDMLKDISLFDTSNYPVDDPLYSNVNKMVIGKMKDECDGRPIQEFVGLRAKMYSILYDNGKERKRAKGVKKSVVARNITHADYVDVLQSGGVQKHLMRYFRSDNHNIFTTEQNKTSLSANDDKRYILDDGITTLAHGHYNIKKYC
jgi:hypothetical protein